MFALALSALALAGTAPVSGGTPAERAVVRHALTAVDPGAVTSARIDGRHELVLGAPAVRTPGVRRERSFWEARALVATIAQRLAALGHDLAGYRIAGSFVGGGPGTPRVGPPGASHLRAVALANARSASLRVRSARVLPVGGGLVDVVIRLREDQLLDAAAQEAVKTLFGPSRPDDALHFLSVEAPGGRAVAYGGTFSDGGLWSYGGDTGTAPVPRRIPEALRRARVDLVVKATRATPTGGHRTFHIVCDGSIPSPGSSCARVLADRWALLVPMPAYPCAGGIVGGWTVSVEGRFAGRPVSRGYDGCYSATVLRWVRFLRLA